MSDQSPLNPNGTTGSPTATSEAIQGALREALNTDHTALRPASIGTQHGGVQKSEAAQNGKAATDSAHRDGAHTDSAPAGTTDGSLANQGVRAAIVPDNAPIPDTVSLNDGKRKKSGTFLYLVSTFIFAMATILSTSALAWKGTDWGLPAFILLVGVAVVGILAMLTLLVRRTAGQKHPYQDASEDLTRANAAFNALPIASIIQKSAKGFTANQAFNAFVAQYGGDPKMGLAAIDAIFVSSGQDTAAALFRLHNLKPDQSAREIVYLNSDNSSETVTKISLFVSASPRGTLWQIQPMSENFERQKFLADAPIGLLSIDTKGRILEMNQSLLEWLGMDENPIEAGEVLHLQAFVEDTDSLLSSPAVIGRTVRCDTRLITDKGATSPTVMSAIWRQSEWGEVYASIALYGHTGLGGRSRDRDGGTPNILASDRASGALSAVQTNGDAGPSHDQHGGIDYPHDNNDHSKALRTKWELNPIENDVVGAAPFGTFQIDMSNLLQAQIVQANPAFFEICGLNKSGSRGVILPLSFQTLLARNPENDGFLKRGVRLDDEPIDLILMPMFNQGTFSIAKQVNVYFSARRDGGYVGYMIDISKRKDLEDRLMQSQKMQAIGQLAGGVAHDFNNLLTVIRLNTDELLGRHPIGDPSYPELQQINQTVQRSAGLVKKLLAFSRKQTMRVEALSVTDTLSDLTVMLKQVMVERVKLDVIHGRNLPFIMADKTQLETILMNLCVNARDAMVETGRPGTITLRSFSPDAALYVKDDIEMPQNVPDGGGFDHAASNNTDQDLGYVVIEVADTGTGMSDEVKKKIFEPFFTTKEQGKGTGLGLATVYGIVQQMKGRLRLDSVLGAGTTFRIYIPIGDEKTIEALPVKVVEKKVKPYDLAGEGCILFVEDEAAVRSIAAKTLRKRGYEVIEAGDGEEALEILEGGEYKFDLMVSDVVMPGLEGPQLLKKGRQYLGDASIIFISGYAEEEFSELLAEEPDVTFLPKPFTLTQLAQKVKMVMAVDEEE